MKPNCYECAHRRKVPGSAHSSCHHPATAPVHADSHAQLIGMVGRRSGVVLIPSVAARDLRIEGVAHGIAQGWFIWPVNFDPTWLTRCDGFASAATPDVTAKRDRECDCIASGNPEKPKQHGADPHAKNCAVYVGGGR